MSTNEEAKEENIKQRDGGGTVLTDTYEAPSSHKNFWKTFGLDTNTGKLLYQLYGDKASKFSTSSVTDKELAEGLKKKNIYIEESEEKKREKERQREREKWRQNKMSINYPTYKKKEQEKKEQEKRSQRKPLAAILKDTKNYEATERLPEQLATNRDEEKEKLVDAFFHQPCKVMPPSCAQVPLTEEEKKNILENVKKTNLKYNTSENKEDSMINKIKEYVKQLQEENENKINQLNKLEEHINKIDEYKNPKELAKLNLKKIEITNEIKENKRSLKKSMDILDSLK